MGLKEVSANFDLKNVEPFNVSHPILKEGSLKNKSPKSFAPSAS
jgi:hypothetical protein